MSVNSRRRDFLEITAEILDACRNGAKKTQVLYGVNLNFNQMKKYMTLLEARKLIRYDGESRNYRTRELGLSFLADYRELRAALQSYSEKKKTLLDMLEEDK